MRLILPWELDKSFSHAILFQNINREIYLILFGKIINFYKTILNEFNIYFLKGGASNLGIVKMFTDITARSFFKQKYILFLNVVKSSF